MNSLNVFHKQNQYAHLHNVKFLLLFESAEPHDQDLELSLSQLAFIQTLMLSMQVTNLLSADKTLTDASAEIDLTITSTLMQLNSILH